jgi:hypothetical protein
MVSEMRTMSRRSMATLSPAELRAVTGDAPGDHAGTGSRSSRSAVPGNESLELRKISKASGVKITRRREEKRGTSTRVRYVEGEEDFDLGSARPHSAGSGRTHLGGAWMQHPTTGVKKTYSNGDLMSVWKVTQELKLPLEDVRLAAKMFREFGTFDSGEGKLLEGQLDREAFKKVICKLSGKALEDLPANLLSGPFTQVSRCSSDRWLGFKDFAEWYHTRGFDASLNLTQDDEFLLNLAKKHSMKQPDVERYHSIFKESDEDESGCIDFWEFPQVLYKCAKIPPRIGLPPSRVNQLWRIADADGSGEIDFEEFLVFYRKYFDVSANAADPFEGYYRDIRRVSIAVSERARRSGQGTLGLEVQGTLGL